jgi:hypothetical protein
MMEPQPPAPVLYAATLPHHAPVVFQQSQQLGGMMRELLKVSEEDRKAERRATWSSAVLWLTVIYGFISFVFLMSLFSELESFARAVLVEPFGMDDMLANAVVGTAIVMHFGAVIVVIIIARIIYNYASRRDIDNRKLDIPRSLLGMLSPEINPQSPIKLKIDFNAFDHGFEPYRTYQKFPEKVFKQKWLEATIPLKEPITVQISVTTNCKRSARFKRRLRIKDKVSEQIEIVFKAKSPRFDSSLQNAIHQRFSSWKQFRMNACQISPTQAKFGFVTPQALIHNGQRRWQGSNLDALLHQGNVLTLLQRAARSLTIQGRPGNAGGQAGPAPQGQGRPQGLPPGYAPSALRTIQV